MRVRQRAARTSSPRAWAMRREQLGIVRCAGASRARRSRRWPPCADPVHAVVPVAGADQWETVGADAKTAIDRCCTMVVEGPLPRRWFRLEVQVVLIELEERSLQKRDRLVEDGIVGGDGEVAVDRVRQPQPIVGDVRAHATTGRGMPPVLDVAVDELTSGGSKQVLAGKLTLRHDQGDHILELIAESVHAARLVEGGPRQADRRGSGTRASR